MGVRHPGHSTRTRLTRSAATAAWLDSLRPRRRSDRQLGNFFVPPDVQEDVVFLITRTRYPLHQRSVVDDVKDPEVGHSQQHLARPIPSLVVRGLLYAAAVRQPRRWVGPLTRMLDAQLPRLRFNRNMVISMRHGLGHTVGLNHWLPQGSVCTYVHPDANDAMVSDWVPPPNEAEFHDYNTTHTNAINDLYG